MSSNSVEAAEKRVALCMATYRGPHPDVFIHGLRMIYAFARRKEWEFAPFVVSRMHCEVGCNASLDLMERAEMLLEPGQKFTHVFWMDDDVYMTPEKAIALIECVDKDHPVVFSLCFYRQYPHRPSLYEYRTWDGLKTELMPMTEYPENELIRVNASGLCAAAFDRDIFRLIKKPYFDWYNAGPDQAPMTPDGFLCYRFLEAGVPIHCHTGLDCVHIGYPQEVDRGFAHKFKDKW